MCIAGGGGEWGHQYRNLVSNFSVRVYMKLLYCFRKVRSQCLRMDQKVGGVMRSKRKNRTDLGLYKVQLPGVI